MPFEKHCQSRIVELRKKFPGFNITHESHHPPVVALDTAEDASVVDLVKELTGEHVTSTVSYAAEAGQFSQAGFEAVICGPGSIAQAHRANEFIAKEQLAGCDEMLKKLIDKLCSK
ncbi:MAG: M20/M25/M40 family metallo-hydrolase [Bacteroidota bacterium]